MPVRREMKSPFFGSGATPVAAFAVLKEAIVVNGLLKVPRFDPPALLLMNQTMPLMLMVTVAVSVLVPSVVS